MALERGQGQASATQTQQVLILEAQKKQEQVSKAPEEELLPAQEEQQGQVSEAPVEQEDQVQGTLETELDLVSVFLWRGKSQVPGVLLN